MCQRRKPASRLVTQLQLASPSQSQMILKSPLLNLTMERVIQLLLAQLLLSRLLSRLVKSLMVLCALLKLTAKVPAHAAIPSPSNLEPLLSLPNRFASQLETLLPLASLSQLSPVSPLITSIPYRVTQLLLAQKPKVRKPKAKNC